ncbi:MAG: hypothetical protein JNM70_03755 [Anaerolineae bacterium]|nr:hypothetical protein [Anaerolineae bacterium]
MTSDNHSQPRPTEDEIERLTRGERIDDPALDPLAVLRPRVRPDFHRALQEELLMLQSPALSLPESLPSRRDDRFAARRPQPRTLLTLGAALIAALTLGLFIIAGTRPPGPIQTSTTASAVVQPNPDLQPVIVALQDLPRGRKLDQSAFASGALTIAYFDPAVIREGMLGDPAQIDGKVLRYDLARWNPVLSGDLAESWEDWQETNNRLPQGLVAIAIPADQIIGDLSGINIEDTVTVLAQMLFVNVDALADPTAPLVSPEDVQQTTRPLALSALVVAISPSPTGPGAVGGQIITLAVKPEEATTIAWALDARLPILLQRGESTAPALQIIPTALPAEGERTEVRIPIGQIDTERPLLVGDFLDLIAALPVENPAEGSPQRQYQFVARNAQLIGQEGDIRIFSVTLDEAALIDEALRTRTRLAVSLPTLDQDSSGYVTLNIPLPYYGLMDVYQLNPTIRVGDHVDVVVVRGMNQSEDWQMTFEQVRGVTAYVTLPDGNLATLFPFRPVNSNYDTGFLEIRRVVHDAEVVRLSTYTDATGRDFPLLTLLVPQYRSWLVRQTISQGHPYAIFNTAQQP